MIKINLKHTKTSISRLEGAEATKQTAITTAETGLSLIKSQLSQIDLSQLPSDLIAKILLKIFIILSFPFGLKVYEVMNIQELERAKEGEGALLKEKEASIAVVQEKINKFSNLKEKEEEFNKKKKLLSKLARSRLVIPRFLDEVQTIIPASVYLKKISISPKSEDARDVSFAGFAEEEEFVNNFASDLEGIVDRNSLQYNTNTVKEGESAVRVGFDIKAKLKSEEEEEEGGV